VNLPKKCLEKNISGLDILEGAHVEYFALGNILGWVSQSRVDTMQCKEEELEKEIPLPKHPPSKKLNLNGHLELPLPPQSELKKASILT
jgi:hypothetical protein